MGGTFPTDPELRRMAVRTALAPSLSLVVLLAACGQLAAPGLPPCPAARLPAPGASAVPPSVGSELLAGLRRRLAGAHGFESVVTSRGEGTWDDGVDRGVRRISRNRARLRWTKPNRLHGEMLEAPFGLMVGGTLDTDDGITLSLRPGGLLSVVALTVSATDVKLRNSRNHTFRDSHPAAQLARLTAAQAVWSVQEDGPGATTVEVTGVRRLDGRIVQEVLAIATDDVTPRSLTMVAAGRPVVIVTFEGFRWR